MTMAGINPTLSFITLNVNILNSQMAEIGIWLYKKKYPMIRCHFRFKVKVDSEQNAGKGYAMK